jgi:NAD(P)-dependent dehydrogenase (short-subunit alcohol dehydrogenase family)
MTEWFAVEHVTHRFRVRQASPGEVIRTPMGSALAEDGQYVLEGDGGDQWLLDFATLDKYFRLVQRAEPEAVSPRAPGSDIPRHTVG